jgi:hypothetical protein
VKDRSKDKHIHKYKHDCIYIYIYICVCVCMCVCVYTEYVSNSGTVWGDQGEEGEEKRMTENE